MQRGTTPTEKIRLNFRLLNVQGIEVLYKQQKHPRVIKTMDEMDIQSSEEESLLTFKLTEKETLRLLPGYCNVQLRIRLENDEIYMSKLGYVWVKDNSFGFPMKGGTDEYTCNKLWEL